LLGAAWLPSRAFDLSAIANTDATPASREALRRVVTQGPQFAVPVSGPAAALRLHGHFMDLRGAHACSMLRYWAAMRPA
jgi:hypothetical protein